MTTTPTQIPVKQPKNINDQFHKIMKFSLNEKLQNMNTKLRNVNKLSKIGFTEETGIFSKSVSKVNKGKVRFYEVNDE